MNAHDHGMTAAPVDVADNLKDKDPQPIIDRMSAGDYENLIAVFDAEFGSFVTLHR